jgi:hypothetical protein
METKNAEYRSGTVFFIYTGIISAVIRVEFVSDKARIRGGACVLSDNLWYQLLMVAEPMT